MSKINEVFEVFKVSEENQPWFVEMALIALAQKMMAHFALTDGGHYVRGPLAAMKALKILTPWKF